MRYNRKHFGCKISGCLGTHEGLGYCKHHYLKLYRHGNPLATPHIGMSKQGKYFPCDVCGKNVYVIRSRFGKKHFCSRKCSGVFLRGKKLPESTLQKMRGKILEKSSSWKGGRTVSPAGYVLIKCPNHSSAKSTGYVLEHRLVMEQKLGRRITHEEHIHHLNGKKDDNRPCNLIVLSNSEHKKLHSRLSKIACELLFGK